MFNSSQPHGLQHTRLLCPLLSPRVCSNSCVNSGLNNTKVLPYSSGDLKTHWTNINVLAGLHFFLQAPGENLLPCLPCFQRLPLFLGLWPSSIFQERNSITAAPASIIITHPLTPLPSCFTYEDPHDSIGSTWIIQDNLPISKSLMEIHLQSPLCRGYIFTGFRNYTRILWGKPLFYPTTKSEAPYRWSSWSCG